MYFLYSYRFQFYIMVLGMNLLPSVRAS